MKDLVIFGAGSVGRLVHNIIDDINQDSPDWHVLGFLDSDQQKHGTEINGVPVLGGIQWLKKHCPPWAIIAISQPAARCELATIINRHAHIRFATLVHPLAWIASRVQIGDGTLIYPGVLVDPDVQIGSHVILNKHCTIGHDTTIGDYTTVAPGVNIGGAGTIGLGCDLGINCATIQEVSIGNWSIVGAGAVVIRDLPANITAIGVPAHIIRPKERA